MGNTAAGILVMLLSTSMMNVGSVVQKKAVDLLPPLDGQPLLVSIRSVLGSPRWIVGWLMTSSAMVLNMVAVGLADISVVQPLNGFGLVVLAVFSRIYLGERLGGLAAAGIGCVIVGVAIIGATVPESRSFATAAEITGAYARPAAGAAIGGLVVAILLLWAVARRARRLAGVLFAFVAACSSVTGLTFSKGLFGLFALIGLASTLAMPSAYLLGALLLVFSALALALQTLSFQKGRAVVVTPVFAASSVALPLLPGSLVFGETIEVLTALALLFIVAGVVMLGARSPANAGGGESR